MKKIGKLLRWFLLLSKRLLKKPSYLLILALIPVLIFAMGMISKQESGMLTIVVFAEGDENSTGAKLANDFCNEQSVIRFVQAKSAKDAVEAVRTQKVDAAWIFPADFDKRLQEYAEGEEYAPKLVRIVECEDNVILQLSREKLYGVMYPYLSYSIYDGFVRNRILPDKEWDSEEIDRYYEGSRIDESIFRLAYAGDLESEIGEEKDEYLLAPLRGMLSLVIALCSLAAVMYFKQDEQNGVFDRISLVKRQKFIYIYQIIAMIYVAIAVLIAYFVTGLSMGLGNEMVNLVLYMLACCAFSSLYARICHNLTVMGATLPIVMILMLILCPVFFAVKKWRVFQYMLPAFYYLNGIFNSVFTVRMIIFCVACVAIDFVIIYFKKR